MPSAPSRCRPRNPRQFLTVYPEVKLTPEEVAAWKHDRQGMIIGQHVRRYQWLEGR